MVRNTLNSSCILHSVTFKQNEVTIVTIWLGIKYELIKKLASKCPRTILFVSYIAVVFSDFMYF